MKVELLKNKMTNIIEKIIINNGVEFRTNDISELNMTHDDIMIYLNERDVEWHEKIMLFNYKTNKIDFLNDFNKNFKNDKENYYILINMINLVFKWHDNHKDADDYDRWFFNYYMWSIIFSIYKKIDSNIEIDDRENKIVNPIIMLFSNGLSFLEKYNIGIKYKDIIEKFNNNDQEENIKNLKSFLRTKTLEYIHYAN